MSVTGHVVHVVPSHFGKGGVFGGAERYVLELGRFMSRRVPTSVVAFGPAASHERIENLDVHVLRNWIHFRRFVYDPVSLRLLEHLRRADIIHFHQTFTMMGSLALVYAKLARKPIFTSDLGGGGLGLHRMMEIGPYFNGHLHISEFSRSIRGHSNVANARVIYGGVDVDKFSPDETVQRTGEVLFVGRLMPHKGINYLVEAVDADTPLLLAGRRWRQAQPLYDLMDKLAVGKKVTIRDDLDDHGIIDAYRRALCIVLPSVFTTVFGEKHAVPELLGQTLIEGMACGTPAICTDTASLPEVVEHGVTGFVVRANDASAIGEKIRWLKEHPAEAARMGRAARERVLKMFTWDRVVDRCLEAYAHA